MKLAVFNVDIDLIVKELSEESYTLLHKLSYNNLRACFLKGSWREHNFIPILV